MEMQQLNAMMQEMTVQPTNSKNVFSVHTLMQSRYRMNNIVYPSILYESERELLKRVLYQLQNEYRQCDVKFAQQIASQRQDIQFIFTQQRWAQQMKESQDMMKQIQMVAFTQGQCKEAPPAETLRDALRLAVGGYIESPCTGKYYLNLGQAANTLQGFIYFAVEFDQSFITDALRSETPFPSLVAKASVSPRLAIKYYHKQSCVKGVDLSGRKVKERATIEMKVTRSIYHKALTIANPLFPWLPAPSKNVIRCYEYWETPEEDAYYMVMEYANCGELLCVIDHLHSSMNYDKLTVLNQIQEIEDPDQRIANINAYKDMLQLNAEGQNAYIEFVRYIFQQMVQAVATMHNQGVYHLDISLENFVVHFDEDGTFLLKLIDFGRAKRVKKKPNLPDGVDKNDCWGFEEFDFTVATPPGKVRYTSAQGALFLKYQDSDAYDASKEDVYSLAVCLYSMLTGDMPWNFPFFIEPEPNNPDYGYLNGVKKRKIDLRTMRDAESGLEIPQHLIDPLFHRFQSVAGVVEVVQGSCYLDYFSSDALDLLCRLFSSRMNLKELAGHRFVSGNPNPELRDHVITQYAKFRQTEFERDQKHSIETCNKLTQIDEQWLQRKATLMTLQMRLCAQRESAINQGLGQIATLNASNLDIAGNQKCAFLANRDDDEKEWSDGSLQRPEDRNLNVRKQPISNGIISGNIGNVRPQSNPEPDMYHLELPYEYAMSPSPEFSPGPEHSIQAWS